jgi:molybdopterin-guanine dinucleotide biosynthesis protein
MTDSDAAHAAETLTLNEGQQAAYDAVMAWLEARDPRKKQADGIELRYKKPKFELPDGAEEWFSDNPDDYFVLAGFSGSGKSTLTSKIIVDLSEKNWNIAVTAPTNRAVGVVQEKVREYAKSRVVAADFRSLHSVLGMRMTENDDGTMSIASTGQSALDQFNLLLVDECSMLDSKVLLREVQASRGACLVLMVGDPAQIPSVMEGSVSKAFRLPQGSMLRQIVRQAEGNPIIAASMHVRKRSRVDEILAAPTEYEAQRIMQSISREDRVQASELMDFLPADCFIRGTGRLREKALELQRDGVDARIICYTNRNVLSCNESIHFDLYPNCGNSMFVIGERVLVQSACKAESLDTGKEVSLASSEEFVIEDVESVYHPVYVHTRAYQLALRDDLGNLVMVYTPRLMSAFQNKVSELFGEVNRIDHEMRRNPGDKTLRDKRTQARNAAWACKNSFAEIRHCYASTVYKIQGASMDRALVDLPDLNGMQSNFLFMTAQYVAITRAKEQTYIAY